MSFQNDQNTIGFINKVLFVWEGFCDSGPADRAGRFTLCVCFRSPLLIEMRTLRNEISVRKKKKQEKNTHDFSMPESDSAKKIIHKSVVKNDFRGFGVIFVVKPS